MRLSPRLLAIAVALTLTGCANQFPGFEDPAQPAPQAAPAEQAPQVDPNSPAYFRTVVGNRVFFAVDESTLTAEARAILDGQVGWLQANGGYLAIIEGHADEQGTREYNLALSARRASAVQEYLVSRGVRASRLTIVPYGKERPVAVCSTESCYARNRRAVTVLTTAPAG